MKKLIAVFSVICMTVSLITMPATVNAASQLLCDMNFEAASTIDLTCSQDGWQDTSVIASVDKTDAMFYGLGSKVADFQTDTTQWHCLYTTFEQSESIKAGENENAGYTVELSFDLCPATDGSKIRVLAEGSSGFDTGNNVMGLEFTGNKTIRYYERNAKTVVAEKALSAFLDESALGAEHFYRIRVIFSVNNESGAPYCDVYVDGVKVFEQQAYAQNAKQRYIAGLGLGSAVTPETVISVGRLDNLHVVSYDADAKAEFALGLPKDLLLGNIRTAAALAKNEELSDDAKAALNTAVEAGIENYASTDEAVLADAAASLESAVKEAKKSLSGSNEPDPDIPQDGFRYIVHNDYESSKQTPFTGTAITTVSDNTPFIGKAWKLTDAVNLTSDVFEAADILNNSTEPKGTDSIVEFDIKFENLCAQNASFSLTQLYDQTPDGTQIACLTFEKGGIKKMDGGGKTHSTIATNVFEDDVWYRIRIVQHAVNSDGTFPQDMSLYMDGEPIAEHFERRSRTAAKTRFFNQIKLIGLGDEVAAYIDNLSIYKVSDTTENPPLNLGKAVKAVRSMQSFLNTAVVGDGLGEYDNEDYQAIKTAYDAAMVEIPQLITQTEVDDKAQALSTLLENTKPNQGKVWVDYVSYSETELKTASNINTEVVVSTSRLADETNDILALSVLYRNAKDYPSGEMLAISSDTATLGKKASATLKPAIDLSGYSAEEKENFYIKTYVLTGKDRETQLSFDGAVLGTVNRTEVQVDNLYGQSADIFKKELADSSIYFSLSAETEKDDTVLVFVTKAGNTVDDLADIAGNNAKDKLEYFQISDADENGKYSFSFKPKAEGTYRVVAYSQEQGKIYDGTCIYKNAGVLSQTLADLKSGTVKIADVKQMLDLDSALFTQCNTAGIVMDKITESIFKDSASVDAYEFKMQYLKNMNLLYNIKTADNLDAVTKTLTEYGYQGDTESYDWAQVCEHVYYNRGSVTTLDALKTLLAYQPEEDDSDTSFGGGGGFGGGGFGGGYATTATVDASKTEAETQTPYEENVSVFGDIAEVAWAEEAIIFLAKNNVINGKAEGVFAPNDAITREEFAKIVVNMFGTGKETEVPAFADVDAGSWYYPYVVKAYADGIVKGIGEDVFGVGMQISREDAIVMLYRAGNLKGVSYSDKAEYIPFEDGCASYAQEAVEALAKSGIITGTGNNMLSGGKTLTRAEAAKMVYGLYSFINQ